MNPIKQFQNVGIAGSIGSMAGRVALMLVALAGFFITLDAGAQVTRPFTVRYSTNDNGGRHQ